MKTLALNSLKLFAVVGCVFVMFSCGGTECQTCTLEGQTDQEICDDSAEITDSISYTDLIAVAESLGYTCE